MKMKSTKLRFLLVVNIILIIGIFTQPVMADTANLALNKQIIANNHIYDYIANNANDGRLDTYWEGASNSYPNILTLDIGDVVSIYKIVLKLNPDSSWGTRTQRILIEKGDDNSNYSTLIAKDTYSFDPAIDNSVTITFTETNIRYLRLNFLENSGATAGQLAEIEVYGKGGETTGNPDLIVSDIGWSPVNPRSGDEVTFNASIENIGSGPSPDGVIHGVSFMIDGTQVNWSDDYIMSLDPGESATLVANGGLTGKSTWTAGGGTHTVEAWVDDVNRITNELDENNNIYNEEIVVETGTVIDGNKYEGEEASLTGGTQVNSNHSGYSGTGFVEGYWNQGAATSFTVDVDSTGFYDITLHYANALDGTVKSLSIYVNNDDVKQTLLPSLPDWETWGDKVEVLYLEEGINTISYKYDPDDSGNINIDYISLVSSEISIPDMKIQDLGWTPDNPLEGDGVTFEATIVNQGTAATPAGIIHGISFNIAGQEVSWSRTYSNSIPAGDSVVLSAEEEWISIEGDYIVEAVVDGEENIDEISESNNSLTKNIRVYPLPGPDLLITDIQTVPVNPQPGEQVVLKATIKNDGVDPSPAITHSIGFQIDDGNMNIYSDNYSTPLNPGEEVTITANVGSWTAEEGNHIINAVVDYNNTITESDENNNSTFKNVTVYGERGASMPYTRYESEDAVRAGGAELRESLDFDIQNTASEASNQKYVALPYNGSYVEWTVNENASGVNMRFTMPDSSDGMGLNGSLDCFVNGTKVKTIQLSSYWSWQYFSGDQPQDTPGGNPRFRFDEVHFLLENSLQPGDILRIEKTNNDGLEYGVDFVEIEQVPDPVQKPDNAYAVTDYGAVPNDGVDDLDAFVACVEAADTADKDVYIPAGKFELGAIWRISAFDIKITGAGIWYTEVHFTSPDSASGGISGSDSCSNLEFCNIYLSSMLRSRYGQQAIYKCFMDTYGTDSYIHDFWQEHFECGFWVADYDDTIVVTDNLLIENGRIRNNLADGVNFCQGTKNSTVRNCSVRNNGDDALAVWPDSTMGAPMGVNNIFEYNTIENNWRAGGIAIFGGDGHQIHNNIIKDGFAGSGIRLNTTFPGYHFDNTSEIKFYDNTIVSCGTSRDCYNGERGAIDLEASNTAIRNITFENIDIFNTQRDAIQFGYGGGFSGINFNNINIVGTGKDAITTSRFTQAHEGKAIMSYTGNGTVTFNDLTMSDIEADDQYLIPDGFNLIIN